MGSQIEAGLASALLFLTPLVIHNPRMWCGDFVYVLYMQTSGAFEPMYQYQHKVGQSAA